MAGLKRTQTKKNKRKRDDKACTERQKREASKQHTKFQREREREGQLRSQRELIRDNKPRRTNSGRGEGRGEEGSRK
jgi:hypothetical protein